MAQPSDPHDGTNWDGNGGGGGGGGFVVVSTGGPGTVVVDGKSVPYDEEVVIGPRTPPPGRPSSPERPSSSQGISPRGLANSLDAARRDASGTPPRDRQPRGASPALGDSKLNNSRLAPNPPRSAPTAAPDWVTQTGWAFTPWDSRLIQPTTSVDTGNTPLNFVLNKLLLPWSNLLTWERDVKLTVVFIVTDTIKLIDDALSNSTYGHDYRDAKVLFPMLGVMGLAVEGAPAIAYASAQLRQWGSAVSNTKNEGVLGALLFPVSPTFGAASDAPALAPEIEGTVPPLSGEIVLVSAEKQAVANASAEVTNQKEVSLRPHGRNRSRVAEAPENE